MAQSCCPFPLAAPSATTNSCEQASRPRTDQALRPSLLLVLQHPRVPLQRHLLSIATQPIVLHLLSLLLMTIRAMQKPTNFPALQAGLCPPSWEFDYRGSRLTTQSKVQLHQHSLAKLHRPSLVKLIRRHGLQRSHRSQSQPFLSSFKMVWI